MPRVFRSPVMLIPSRSMSSRLAAALLALLAAAPAWAGRPLQTEDAGVLGRGACELESFIARERARDQPTVRVASVQIGCGAGGDTQLALAAARARADGEQVDELTLVGKTGLREPAAEQAGVALAYAASATRLPGGSFRHELTQLRAVLTVPRGDWLLHANLGAERTEGEPRNTAIWALAVEHSGPGAFDLMGEVFGDDRNDPWLNAGLRWNAQPQRLMVDASYGVQLDAGRARLLTVGFKFAF